MESEEAVQDDHNHPNMHTEDEKTEDELEIEEEAEKLG